VRGFYFAEFVADTLDCVIDPGAYVGVTTLIDRGVVLSCPFK